MKLSMNEVLKAPYKGSCFSARCGQGRIQGGSKICEGGLFLQKSSSPDRMHSSDPDAVKGGSRADQKYVKGVSFFKNLLLQTECIAVI